MDFPEARLQEIADLAEAVARPFAMPLQPELIAREEGITFSYGKYANAFDGLLQHQYNRFHIYINLNRVKAPSSPRSRFTFAHELGHFFIDEHRNALRRGKTPSHPSFNRIEQNNPVEREADYFASCLLMPSGDFIGACSRKTMSGRLIEDLAAHFQTSLSATLYRYFELDQFPMMLVFSKRGRVEWVKRSKDFRFRRPPARGDKVPPSTVAGEFFQKGTKCRIDEIVYPDDWFTDYQEGTRIKLYEKCYYLSDDTVMSVIWVNEQSGFGNPFL